MSILREAKRVARLLEFRQQKVVFAESCTGGLASGALTAVPGISQSHCGGMVVYRNETKSAWLQISPSQLKQPGPVSREVTAQLARQVLAKTPEADVSAAVTGHLGPNAPARLDGRVFLCIAARDSRKRPFVVAERGWKCSGSLRNARQREAVETLLRLLGDVLSQPMPE